jgi:hypothetical protein
MSATQSKRNMQMRNIIHQTVVLPALIETLFDMYLDPVEHGAITNAAVEIGSEAGAKFNAYDGSLTGTIIKAIKPSLIVQSWRSDGFKEKDPDSTLILSFTPKGNDGQIDLVHLDVPDQDYDGVAQGWKKYYWEPWRAYLTAE